MKTLLARLATVVLLAGSGVVAVPSLGSAQQTDAGEQSEVRIVAQRNPDERVEFGLQQRQPDGSWGERLLPANRFFPAGTEVGRWLASSPLVLSAGAGDSGVEVQVRITAQRLSSGRTEFALQQRQPDGSWGDRLLPANRFFPAGTEVGRWLASSPLVLQIDTAGADTEPAATADVTESTGEEDPPEEDPPEEDPPEEDPPEEDPPEEDPPAEDPPEEERSIVVSGDVPGYNMIDVHTARTVNLRSVVNGDTPLLFWLWSPY